MASRGSAVHANKQQQQHVGESCIQLNMRLSIEANEYIGVDVTAHKETNLKAPVVRYYVEIVIGNVRGKHTRLQFSGTFKALMALHETFERLWSTMQPHSSTDKVKLWSKAQETKHMTPSFPVTTTADKLLVRLETLRSAQKDAKVAARTQALFAYYNQLFHADERQVYLEFVYNECCKQFDNQHDDQVLDERKVMFAAPVVVKR